MRPDDTIATMLPTRLGSFWPMVSMLTPATGLSALALRIQPSIALMKPMIAEAVLVEQHGEEAHEDGEEAGKEARPC